jgi:hypothetical protein
VDADRAQIIDVLTRYATGIDSKNWPLLRSCWADEVDLDYGDVGTFTDPDILTDLFTQLHDPMGPTYHRLSNFVINIDEDGDTATARTYVHAVLMVTPGDNAAWVEAIGHYDDELVRVADGWRIRRRVAHTPRILTGGGPTT